MFVRTCDECEHSNIPQDNEQTLNRVIIKFIRVYSQNNVLQHRIALVEQRAFGNIVFNMIDDRTGWHRRVFAVVRRTFFRAEHNFPRRYGGRSQTAFRTTAGLRQLRRCCGRFARAYRIRVWRHVGRRWLCQAERRGRPQRWRRIVVDEHEPTGRRCAQKVPLNRTVGSRTQAAHLICRASLMHENSARMQCDLRGVCLCVGAVAGRK